MTPIQRVKLLFDDILFHLRSCQYKGNNFYCPLCNFKAKKFLDSPYGIRKNVRCPRCNSLERHRAQWIFGLRNLKFFNYDSFSVLHFAPEFCISQRLIKTKNCIYKTAEYSSKSLADYHIDIQNTELNPEMFDIVICNHILEHVDDDHKALKEIFRILKTGGKAFIQVPVDINLENSFEDSEITDPVQRKVHFGQQDHKRLYGNDFPKRLEKAGFSVSTVRFWEKLSEKELNYYAITDFEPVYICSKHV